MIWQIKWKMKMTAVLYWVLVLNVNLDKSFLQKNCVESVESVEERSTNPGAVLRAGYILSRFYFLRVVV